MCFGLSAEIPVRCGHCGEKDWRTPVELKSGRLICFMCGEVTLVPPRPPTGSEPLSAAAEIARRLAILQPPPPPGGEAGAADEAAVGPAGPSRRGLSIVPKTR